MSQPQSNVAVIIPAAGRGTRMGGQRKQYRNLGQESLLGRTLRLFDDHPRVSTLTVAVSREDVSRISAEVTGYGLRKIHDVVAGGRSRQTSVAAALEATPADTQIVLVHDAVRPFLPPDLIDAVVTAVEEWGAAALAIPATDTLRRVRDRDFEDTVDRDDLYLMQTPQGFRKDWFVDAHEAARRQGIKATDDVDLVTRAGKKVRLVAGSPLNFKVTTPEDWVMAQAVWHHLSTSP